MFSTPSTILSTFVIRLWQDANTGQWRGQITHLQSNDRRYVASLEQVAIFIVDHAPGLDPSSPAGPPQPV